MANVSGVNYAKAIDPTSDNILDPGVLGGRVRVMFDSYECATLATDDVILVGQALKDGARVLDVVLFYDALGTDSAFTVGDAGDADRFLTTVSTSSAGATSMTEQATIEGFSYKTTGGLIRIACTGSPATNTIKIGIIYTED